MAKRKKAIEDITARNDIGASRAPWDPLPANERPPPIKVSFCLSVCLSVFLSVCLSVFLSVYLSV